MKKEQNKISVTIDKKIDDIMEKEKVNKSKLTNYLINEFFNKKKDIKNFLK